jgi:hypothetical protein
MVPLHWDYNVAIHSDRVRVPSNTLRILSDRHLLLTEPICTSIFDQRIELAHNKCLLVGLSYAMLVNMDLLANYLAE